MKSIHFKLDGNFHTKCWCLKEVNLDFTGVSLPSQQWKALDGATLMALRMLWGNVLLSVVWTSDYVPLHWNPKSGNIFVQTLVVGISYRLEVRLVGNDLTFYLCKEEIFKFRVDMPILISAFKCSQVMEYMHLRTFVLVCASVCLHESVCVCNPQSSYLWRNL